MSLVSGTRLGPYEIQSPLGAGGMGEVYRARDTRLERIVAVKILPPHLSSDPVRKQRFEREAKTISSLNHPQICTVYDIGQQDGVDYLVMECVEGETLSKRLEKGPLPLEQVLKFGAQIADALDKAHHAGIVHRDLKPGNIMLTSTGAKLLDFGLAKPTAALASGVTLTVAATQTTPVTQEGMIVGTFQYMSPEQIEGKELDARSDIFSLGAVLYEMLTGQRAFPGKSQLSVASAILEKEPAPISSVKPMTPPALNHAIHRCLAKDSEERWQTARDLALELKWIAEGSSQAGVVVSQVRQVRHGERVAWTATVAVLAIAAALLAVGYFWRAPESPRPVISQISPPEHARFILAGLSAGPPVLSPDGTLLAFAAQGVDDKQLLWVSSLDGTTEGPLAGTEGATFPFWSPNSRSLAFFANGKLNRIDVAGGGPPLTVCDAPSARGGAWGTDGTILFGFLASPIFRIAASGGTPQFVTKLSESEFSHRWPQFLPDGKHFLFFGQFRGPAANSAIYVGTLNSSETKLLFRSESNAIYAPPGYILFIRQETLLAQRFDAKTLQLLGDAVPLTRQGGADRSLRRGNFSASENGILVYAPGALSEARLLWFDRDGKQVAETGTADFYGFPRISPDGRKLAVPRVSGENSAIWTIDLDRGTSSRLTFSPGRNEWPVWSPDGKSIAFAFASAEDKALRIYQQAANGTGAATPLVVGDTEVTLPSWSSDGRYVIFQKRPNTGKSPWEIWAEPLFGDRKAFPVLQNPQFLEGDPALSPNGRWLAHSSDESGELEVYLEPFLHSGGKWQVSTKGGTCARWRADGRELFYMSLDNKLMSAEISEQASSAVIGKVQPLFQANPVPIAPECMYEVTPDGKKFLVVTVAQEQGTHPLTLVVNWPALLRKQRQP